MTTSRPPFDLEAGSSDFYRDPTYYEYEFKDRAADARFYVDRYVAYTKAHEDARHAEPGGKGDTVLELGVGAGRIALKAVRKGAKVLGLDITQAMLVEADARREKLPKTRQPHLKLVRGDMRHFAFGRKFGLITCPFNAFQHLYTRPDIEACLASVAASLAPDGRFILDVLVPDLEYLVRPAFKRYPGVRFKHPTHNIDYLYSEQSAYDAVAQINQMWFHYDRAEPSKTAPAYDCIQLSHRCFFPQELEALLHYNGFAIEEAFGDFESGPLTPDSDSQILVCKRR